MRAGETVLLAVAQAGRDVVPARAQMATTLGFHIILACLGIALPAIVLLAEFIGLRRQDATASRTVSPARIRLTGPRVLAGQDQRPSLLLGVTSTSRCLVAGCPLWVL